ncbi:hypothetical protein R6Q59_016738 [Mikania micrantha]
MSWTYGAELQELKRSNYAANPLINPTSITISTTFTEVEGRVLEPSKLRFGNCGDWFSRGGRWNFNKKVFTVFFKTKGSTNQSIA